VSGNGGIVLFNASEVVDVRAKVVRHLEMPRVVGFLHDHPGKLAFSDARAKAALNILAQSLEQLKADHNIETKPANRSRRARSVRVGRAVPQIGDKIEANLEAR
jgi:hypothetical protein